MAEDPSLSEAEFEAAVADALDDIPATLLDRMDNVALFVEAEPGKDEPELLGVYDGIPLTERGDDGADLPDRITIFSGPLTRLCSDREELVEQIAVTVVHEIAHHFGIDDERLHNLGWG
ncbi:metallopeptidase family protein [soil metagenome]